MNRRIQKKERSSADVIVSEAESVQKRKIGVRKNRSSMSVEEPTARSKLSLSALITKLRPGAKKEPKNSKSDNKEKHSKTGHEGLKKVASATAISPASKNMSLSEKTARSYKKNKSRKKARAKSTSNGEKKVSSTPISKAVRQRSKPKPKKKDSMGNPEKSKPLPVNVSSLEKGTAQFLEFLSKKNLSAKLEEQWDSIEDIEVPDDLIQAFLDNEHKNRAEQIECLDSNRIKLEKMEGGDYIHASSVELKDLPRKFILAQLPRVNPALIEDFWLMIYQQNVHNMYLIAHPDDSIKIAKEKFAEFFPLAVGDHEYYGEIWLHNRKVEMANEIQEKNNDVYIVEVLPEGCAESVIVTINLCTYWPNGEIPAHIAWKRTVLTAGSVIGAEDSYEQDPVAIVSKCGAGRAGTFLAITACINALKMGKSPDVGDIAFNIRNQRPGGIDKQAQFHFVYQATLKFISLFIVNKDLKLKVEEMKKKIEKISNALEKNQTAESSGSDREIKSYALY